MYISNVWDTKSKFPTNSSCDFTSVVNEIFIEPDVIKNPYVFITIEYDGKL